ncbi:SDR family NAD(P)-dependent oxidoreductase [Natronocalculus amylovorans]|uniref:SDR family oxidoreductase n=1 Tax=Natronocalculus amylovorans TaxID=2917812 RepID=A0AAE3K7U2_9EURY|nr:SDR family oxidoreductase [Natronocalculus amylovorans]MCL9816582.1 SDR family oxidoreductase [Natronocalculus amylovorans]NUE01026.1 SDR family oxidoreductase [Halorubraceae archaeon YAN]
MDDRTVVVTGGTRGIGRAVVTAFADAGATVVFCGRDRAAVEDIAEITGAIGVRADVRDEFDVERLMETAAREGDGEIELVVANAAVNHGTPGKMPIAEEPYSRFDDTMRTNVRGIFTTIVEALPHLASDGRVLVPSGSIAREAKPNMGTYAISKAGSEAVVRAFATDIEQPVCIVDPGLVATELTGVDTARDPEDVAPMFVWAATEATEDEINGEIVDLRTWKKATR